jgi:hypothetical protein
MKRPADVGIKQENAGIPGRGQEFAGSGGWGS